MSFMLWARPAPVDIPEPSGYGTAFKYAVAEKFFGISGSIRTGKITFPSGEYDSLKLFLKGAKVNATKELCNDIDDFFQLLDENPQGIELWIGDHCDY